MGCKLNLKDDKGQSVDHMIFGRIFEKFDLRPAKGETLISTIGEKYEINEISVEDSMETDDVIWTYIIKKRKNGHQTGNSRKQDVQ